LSRDKIGKGHVRFLNRIKGLSATTKTAKRAATEGWRAKLVADEVVISGRNFKQTKDLVRQFVADYQSALECFQRDTDGASAEQPNAATTRSQDSASAGPGLALTDAAESADVASPTLAANLMKQAVELRELLSFFNRPMCSG
jgi:hypothetical protein